MLCGGIWAEQCHRPGANDTLVGALVIALSVLIPMMPGKAHHMAMMMPGPDIGRIRRNVDVHSSRSIGNASALRRTVAHNGLDLVA